MPKRRRKLDVVCPNKACRGYNKKGLRNIVRNGKKLNGTQCYKCADCGTQFVRTRGTILYHKKLRRKDVAEICRHLVETNSFRGVARELRRNKNTICAYAELIANHCEEVNDILINDVKLGAHEIDELWTFVKKNKKKSNQPNFATQKPATRTAIST
jgi:transposase-like protein